MIKKLMVLLFTMISYFSFGEEIVTNETINFLKDQTIRIHNLSNNLKSQLLFTILGFTLFMTLE